LSDQPNETEEPKRSAINQLGQAARQHWPITEDQQKAIVAYLTEVATNREEKVGKRTKIAAAKALSQFGRLALEQQKVDQAARLQATKKEAEEEIDIRDVLLFSVEELANLKPGTDLKALAEQRLNEHARNAAANTAHWPEAKGQGGGAGIVDDPQVARRPIVPDAHAVVSGSETDPPNTHAEAPTREGTLHQETGPS
jgi:hypothetical protein